MDKSKLSKDLSRLLIEKYFDLDTYYKCQYVCKYYLGVVSSNINKLRQSRKEHHRLWLKKKHQKKVDLDILYEMRSICDDIDFGNKSKKEIKREKSNIRKSLFLCQNCGEISKDDHNCVAEKNSALCLMCDVIDKYHACPLKERKCDSNDQSYYKFWTQHLMVKNSITMCEFQGCSAELKRHHLTCKRQCLNCEEFILLEKMQKHLKKCQLHLNAYGILDANTFC